MSRNDRRVSRNALRLEHLEQREVPAIMPAFSIAYNPGTQAIDLIGSQYADVITITQDDTKGVFTISAVNEQAPPVTRRFDAQQIRRVSVSLGDGDDRFTFQTVGEVRFAKIVQLDLGAGADDAVVRWADTGGIAKANLELTVRGGAGSDAIGARIGKLARGVFATITADGGEGADGIGVQSLNPTEKGSAFAVVANGGAGDDSLQYFGTGTIGKDATVKVTLDGQAGNDTITGDFQGRVDGTVNARFLGGAGNDQFTVAARGGVAMGRLTMALLGGEGDDLAILDNNSREAAAKRGTATLDGGAGNDYAVVSEGVALSNTEATEPVTAVNRPIPNESFDPVLPTKTLRAGGREIEYWTTGQDRPDRPVIVLISGAGGSIDSWLPIADQLQGLGKVISVNKPGYGRTDPTGQYYADTVVEDIRAVVTRIAPNRPVILVGHSLGGPYSNLFARLHPNEVKGVVFVDATAQVEVSNDEVAMNSPVYRVAPRGIRDENAVLGDTVSAPLHAAAFPAIPVIALAEDLPFDEFRASAQELADLGAPGELRFIPNTGHYIQADQPQVVVTAIKDMLKRTEISGILADVAAKYGIPGLSAAVIVDGKVISGTAGVKQAGGNSPVTAGDTFQNGSTTKAMTATLAGILVDRGLLRWNSTIGELFPELRGRIRADYLGTTVEQLLQHRSGLIADEQASPALQPAIVGATGNVSADRLRLLPLLLNEPPANPAGEFNYSNAGLYVVATMMERVTGRPYEGLMSDEVFRPLGMSSATFTRPAVNSNTVKGHDQHGQPVAENSEFYKIIDIPILNPAGANLRMTATDWAKFVRVHLGETVNGTRLLRAETLARLHTPAFVDLGGVNYADGWVTQPAGFNGSNPTLGASLTHSGSDGVWYADVVAYPDSKFATLVMMNTAVAKDSSDIGVAAAEIQKRLGARYAPKPSPAVASPSEAIRQALAPIRHASAVPAVAAGVVVNGAASFAAVGVRQAGSPQAVSDSDRFHLGSAGKSMTATLAAILVERGVLRWDSTVAQIFPELRGSIRTEYLRITLEELFNHRSGMADFTTEADVAMYTRIQQSARFPSEGRTLFLKEWMKSVPPANAAGVYHYSNVGYTLAGAMMERAAGRSFEWLMRETILQPLGMTTAEFGFPTSRGVRNQPSGHDENGVPIRVDLRELPDILSPSGGVSMNMADWSKYLRVHLGENVNGVRLLSAASLAKLHTPDAREVTDQSGTFRYGFGWRTAQTPLGEALGHEGEVPGFYSRVGIIPSLGIAVFSAVNQLGDVSQPTNEAVTSALLSLLSPP